MKSSGPSGLIHSLRHVNQTLRIYKEKNCNVFFYLFQVNNSSLLCGKMKFQLNFSKYLIVKLNFSQNVLLGLFEIYV